MKVYEFILLVLGIASLIHYIRYSLFRYNNMMYFITGVYKENESIPLIRFIEFIIISINIALWVYKLFF